MLKKIIKNSNDLFNSVKLSAQHQVDHKMMEELSEDTFETVASRQERLDSEIEGIEFKFRKIQYAPEDVEKMKGMSHSEKNRFISQLKKEGKFTYVEE